MFLVSSCSCLCPIQWSQMLIREWRCSWSSADRRCSNYIWVIDNFITTKVPLILETWRYCLSNHQTKESSKSFVSRYIWWHGLADRGVHTPLLTTRDRTANSVWENIHCEFIFLLIIGLETRPNASTSTHCGVMARYGDIDLGPYWLRYWLTWQHQARTRTSLDFSSVKYYGFHLGFHRCCKITRGRVYGKITHLKSQPHFHGDKEFKFR